MKIGIISDTHDNVENVLKAVKVFKSLKVDFVVHCGDMVAPKTVDYFAGVKLKMVKGNCDGDIDNLGLKLRSIGGEYLGEFAELFVDGKKFLAYHGHDPARLDSFIKSGLYQYILTGHNHKSRDEPVGRTRVLNPGAHYYGGEGTVMILDLQNDNVDLVTL
ncbi:MAG: metallophosphoesterase [Candidatus Woesearchaeota archaeon]